MISVKDEKINKKIQFLYDFNQQHLFRFWNDLADGEFQLEITSFDIFGEAHRTDLRITLFKDTRAPSIGINLPVNNTYWNSVPYLNISAIDPNLDKIWYSVNNINILDSR